MEDLECVSLISLRRFLKRAWEKCPDAQDGQCLLCIGTSTHVDGTVGAAADHFD